MTATHTPGLPTVEDGLLVSTNPANGEEVARVPIAGPEDVAAAVDRARTAAAWWAGLGFAGRRTRLLLELARRMRSGMTAVNSVLSFAAMPGLPYGGVGDSGFGRMSGDDGLREFARSKAITARRAPSLLPIWTFKRDPDATARRVVAVIRLLHGRSRLPQPPSVTARFRR